MSARLGRPGRDPLDGRVVVVTGASAGVGRATVRAFAARGARLGLLARGPEGLEAARAEVEATGARALAVPVDVADAEALDQAADAVESTLGQIDVWINNAMTSVLSPVAELTADEVRRVTEVTYLGAVNGTLTALRRMLPRDRGVIVQVGSGLAYRSIPFQAAYCGAKFALRGFTDSLRSELIHADSGVRVTMVHLPALNTPQFRWVKSRLPYEAQPLPPIFQPEVAAQAIVWLTEHDRRELNVGTRTDLAILANKVAPGLLDRYLADAAWDGQMSDEPLDPDRPSNLWEPIPGDHGAHGVFDAMANPFSPQLWATTHRPHVATAVALGLAGLAALRRRSRRR